jgi:hypothetical protein
MTLFYCSSTQVCDRNRRVKRATRIKFHEMIVQLNPVLAMGLLTTSLQVTRQAGNVCTTQHWRMFMQPLLQWKSNVLHILSVCVALGMQPAIWMPHIIICGLPDLAIFFHVSHKQNIFCGGGEGVIKHKTCVLIFSAAFVWNVSPSTNSARYHKWTHVFRWSTHYSCWILMKHELSWQIFKKYSDIKFHKNPSSGSQAVPYRRTDRYDEANSCFSQFCERA